MIAIARSRRTAGWSLVLQLLVCGVAAFLIALPPATARATLLVPLTTGARAALPARALDGSTTLIGAGLLPGSLIVRGAARGTLAWLRHGVIALAVPLRACGPA